MMKIKQIGDVELKAIPNSYNELTIHMSIEMNGKIYKRQDTVVNEMWDEARYIKSIVQNFLQNVALQEYDVEFFKELSVEQKEFLPKLQQFIEVTSMGDSERKFIEGVKDNGGYTKKERKILNILIDKYKEGYEKMI